MSALSALYTEFSAALTTVNHNLMAYGFLDLNLQNSLLAHLNVSPFSIEDDKKSWPLKVTNTELQLKFMLQSIVLVCGTEVNLPVLLVMSLLLSYDPIALSRLEVLAFSIHILGHLNLLLFYLFSGVSEDAIVACADSFASQPVWGCPLHSQAHLGLHRHLGKGPGIPQHRSYQAGICFGKGRLKRGTCPADAVPIPCFGADAEETGPPLCSQLPHQSV